MNARINFHRLGIIAGIVMFAALSWGSAWAAPVNSQRAAATVLGWLKAEKKPLGEALGGSVRRVETFRDAAGGETYHVVYLEPSGFVIVAGEDLVEPIPCFAPVGVFDPSDGNPLGALVNRDIPRRVAMVRRAGRAALGLEAMRTAAKWHQFELAATNGGVQANLLSSVSDVRVSPLTQTTWDQSTAGNYYQGAACYNYYTPPYAAGANTNYVSGCVATAMAQLMFYYQYPTTGVGTASFGIEVNGVPTSRSLRGGNGSGGPYDWGHMLLSPPSNPTPLQCQAIGALTADAGVSVGMAYSSGASSADLTTAKTALKSTFYYSSAIDGHNNGFAELGTNLVGMLNPCLDAHNPVLLGIQGSVGGHAVVADGYGYSAATLYHHLNLGWSGASTAWYALPIIDTVNGTFNVVDECVYNIFTNGSGEIISGRVLDQNSLPVVNATVTATRNGSGTLYTANTDTNGIYALSKLPSASRYSLVATKTAYTSASGDYSTTTSYDNRAASGNVWGANFTLSSLPTAVDHFGLSAIGNQGVGIPFSVTISALNTTNGPASFASTVAFSASGITAVSNVLVGNLGDQQISTDLANGWTDGYVFTPNTNLQVVAVRGYFGTKVSIWTGSGSLLASQNVPNQSGTWVETSLAAPVTLVAGSSYRVGVYYPAGTTEYLTKWAGEWPTNFNNGTVGQNLYYKYGDGFPNSINGTGLGPFLDLRYTVQAQASVPISPANSSAFVNGAWYGNITVLQVASNVVVKADDGGGQIGLSSAFNVGQFAPIHMGMPQSSHGGQIQFTLTGGYGIEIQASTNLVNWISLATLTNTTGTTNFTDSLSTFSRRFYRAHQVP
jgi:hypothetical protein